nr:unnamed protein product [Naegleria fowleri]
MSEKITVKVKAMNGQQLELKVDPNMEVEDFKKLIAEKSNAAPNLQRLIYQGKVLKNGSKLSDYKIVNDHVIHLVNLPNENVSSSSESSSTQQRTQPSHTSSQSATQNPHTTGFHAAFGPGITVVSGMNLDNPSGAGGSTGRIDIGSLVNNVLSGIFQPPSSSTQTHTHPHRQHGTNNTSSNNNQASRTARTPVPSNSIHTNEILNGGREVVNFLDGNQRQSVVNDLNRMTSLFQSSASSSNRQEFLQIRQHVLPSLVQLQSNLNMLISGLNGRTSTNVSSRENNGAAITNVNLHLHVNSNELDALPNQLQRLHSMINASPLAPRDGNLERPVSVTSTTQPISNHDVVNEIFSGSRGSTPSSTTAASTSPSAQPSSTTTTTQSAPSTSLHSLINNVMGAFGVSQPQEAESERGFFDRMITIATDSLQLPDLFSVMSGNWAPLDATKEKLKTFLINDGLQGDCSHQSRQRKIEELMAEFEKYLDQNHDLQFEIASRANNESDVLGQLVEVARFYITMLFNLIIEDVSMYPHVTDGAITSSTFSAALNRFTTLFLGEIVELFEMECISGSSKVLIPLLLDSMFKSLPNSVQTFYRNQGGSLISSFAERRHQEYKTQFPNRPISRMPKPVLDKVEQPSKVTKEEKSTTSSSTNTTTTATTTSSSSVVPPGTQSDSDKLLEELMAKDAMDLLEDVMPTKVDTKPSSVASSTDSSRSTTPVTTNATSTTAATTSASNNDWKKGLSEEEIKEINDTINQDEAMMELNENDKPRLSDAYKLSGYLKKEKDSSELSSSRRESARDLHQEDEEDVELD